MNSTPPGPDRSWLERLLQQTVEIMKAAVGEFSLAALLVVVGTVLATVAGVVLGGLVCIGAGAGLGYFGHRRGLVDVSAERRRLETGHQERLAEIARTERLAEIAHEEHLAELAARERIAQTRRRQLEVPVLAAEVRASGPAVAPWRIQRGEKRRTSAVPPDVDQLEYLIYRHTRSAEAPPMDPSLPAIRHFVDLRDAALITKDRTLMVDLLCEHIRQSFEDHDAYTGVLIPRAGNVALGLAVADRLVLPPVLVREQPLFERTTESVLTAGLLILVDDIWSDGTVLRRAVELARFDNFSISDGVLLFARREGAVVHDLAESNLTLCPRGELGDDDIDAIIARVSAAIDAQRSLRRATSCEALRPVPPPASRELSREPTDEKP